MENCDHVFRKIDIMIQRTACSVSRKDLQKLSDILVLLQTPKTKWITK